MEAEIRQEGGERLWTLAENVVKVVHHLTELWRAQRLDDGVGLRFREILLQLGEDVGILQSASSEHLLRVEYVREGRLRRCGDAVHNVGEAIREG